MIEADEELLIVQNWLISNLNRLSCVLRKMVWFFTQFFSSSSVTKNQGETYSDKLERLDSSCVGVAEETGRQSTTAPITVNIFKLAFSIYFSVRSPCSLLLLHKLKSP